jgi:hypothetical protein
MALGETLEKLFNVETEVTIESAATQLITAGENFKSKTKLPLTKYVLGVSFLEKMANDIDNEMEEVVAITNESKVMYMQNLKPEFRPKKEDYNKRKLSDNITPILNESMLLMPSIDGKAREEFKDVLKWLREERSKQPRQDSVSNIINAIQR